MSHDLYFEISKILESVNPRKLYFETLSLYIYIYIVIKFFRSFSPDNCRDRKIDAREESNRETFRVNGNEIPRILDGIAEGIEVQRVSIEQTETRPSNDPSSLQPVSVRLATLHRASSRWSLVPSSFCFLVIEKKTARWENERPMRDAVRNSHWKKSLRRHAFSNRTRRDAYGVHLSTLTSCAGMTISKLKLNKVLTWRIWICDKMQQVLPNFKIKFRETSLCACLSFQKSATTNV